MNVWSINILKYFDEISCKFHFFLTVLYINMPFIINEFFIDDYIYSKQSMFRGELKFREYRVIVKFH